MKTILGEKYVALDPKGQGQLDADAQIPVARTVSSYDVINAFQDLTTTTERIDTDQLAKSLTVIATEFKDSPQYVKATLDGLSRLSRTVASRDAELGSLLQRANSVTGLVRSRNQQVSTLIKDADLLMVELVKRRDDIRTLFRNTSALAKQLTGLARDNRAQLKPALAELDKTLAHAPEARHRPAEDDPGDGPLHAGLRQHAGHRTLVRHVGLQPRRARSARPGSPCPARSCPTCSFPAPPEVVADACAPGLPYAVRPAARPRDRARQGRHRPRRRRARRGRHRLLAPPGPRRR